MITPEMLLSGKVLFAVLKRREGYVAWTRTWEGPVRPEYMAARADLLDRKGRADDGLLQSATLPAGQSSD